MTRYRVTSTALAERDIADIATYIANRNPGAALDFAVELKEARSRIAEAPQSGHSLPGIDPVIRAKRVSRRFHKYLILYRSVDDTTLQVVRVLHGARDISDIV